MDVAIVAVSLCLGSGGRYVAIPGELHKPIVQAMGITSLSQKPGLAAQFQKYVMSKPGRAILRRYGFMIPGERVSR